MIDKLKILQCLIENRAFASSHSALAKSLGYKGKMVVYRLMEGQVKKATADEIWNKVAERYFLSDITLYNLARVFEGTKYYLEKFLPEMNREHPEWVEALVISLVNDCYDYFSPDFQQKEVPYLKDLKTDEPDIFWGIVTMLYLRCQKFDIYAGNSKEAFCQLIDALDHLLFTIYPERVDAHETSYNLKILETEPNLWKVILNSIILFKRYTQSDYLSNASQCGQLFDWGKRSYWTLPGECYRQGGEVWLFVEQSLGRATNGYYLVLRLEAEKEVGRLELKDVFLFFFWTIDNEDDPCILQVSRGAGHEREWCFYDYEYDEGKGILFLNANSETGDLFELPKGLAMKSVEHPLDMNDKIWSRILRKWEEERGESVFQKAKEWISGRIDLKDEYVLKDVQISRTSLTLFIKRQDHICKYELPIDSYDFLSQINPFIQLIVTKHVDDNEIYVEWPSLGCSVRLSEFIYVE